MHLRKNPESLLSMYGTDEIVECKEGEMRIFSDSLLSVLEAEGRDLMYLAISLLSKRTYAV